MSAIVLDRTIVERAYTNCLTRYTWAEISTAAADRDAAEADYSLAVMEAASVLDSQRHELGLDGVAFWELSLADAGRALVEQLTTDNIWLPTGGGRYSNENYPIKLWAKHARTYRAAAARIRRSIARVPAVAS